MTLHRRSGDPVSQIGIIRWVITAVERLGIGNVLALVLVGFILLRQDQFLQSNNTFAAQIPVHSADSSREHKDILEQSRRQDANVLLVLTQICINGAGRDRKAEDRCWQRIAPPKQ